MGNVKGWERNVRGRGTEGFLCRWDLIAGCGLPQPALQLRAVETVLDRVANCCRFNGVIGFAHARGQLRKLLPAELALSIELMCKTDHAELFFPGKTPDLIDNLLRCHC